MIGRTLTRYFATDRLAPAMGRETHLLSSLNHPNVAAIHGLGDADDQ